MFAYSKGELNLRLSLSYNLLFDYYCTNPSLSKSLHEMFVIIQKRENMNICLDRNTLVLMIDKRSPKRTTMQKVEKKIQAFKSWVLFLFVLGLYVSSRKSSHENKSHTHNDFHLNLILHKNIFAWKVIIYFTNCIIIFDIKNIFSIVNYVINYRMSTLQNRYRCSYLSKRYN